MSVTEFLVAAVALTGISVAVLLLCNRLRIPSTVGQLLTGIVIGPSGIGILHDPAQVEVFAEIGVIFLLFGVGLQFSLEHLRSIGRPFFVGGTIQSAATIGAVALVSLAHGLPAGQGIFLGFLAALSSTAVVLAVYNGRRELETPQGKVLLGILLFQDFLIVPMLVLAPFLAGRSSGSPASVAGLFLLSIASVALVVLAARHLMPMILHRMARSRVREVFVLGALFICLGLALATSSLGLSLALGAFIAGILIAESEYSAQVVADTTPLRDIFTSVFFISVGMLLDLRFVAGHLPAVAFVTLAIVLLKIPAAAVATAVLGYPRRIVLAVSLGLAQVGEFSFVLAQVGNSLGLLEGDLHQLFIDGAILTMMATPLLVRAGAAAGAAGSGALPGTPPPCPRNVAVVIIGFGLSGRNLARVLRRAGISYAVVDLNGDSVKRAAAAGETALYGDCTRPDVLAGAGVGCAQVVVFAISDLIAVERGIRIARGMNPMVRIIVRTRMVSEIERLRRAGADEVVAEEFESSIEIFTRVLEVLRVPRNIVRAETKILRGETYEALRVGAADPEAIRRLEEILARGTTDIYSVGAGSPAAGATIRGLDLRARSGASIIAIVRDQESHANPAPDFVILEGDSLVLVGAHGEIERAFSLLDGETEPGSSPG